MRIRATCDACGRDFLFFQLYNADAWQADSCPHCHADLGVPNLRHLALAADRALTALVAVLEQIAARSHSFTVTRDSVLRPLETAVQLLTEPNDRSDRATRRTDAGGSAHGPRDRPRRAKQRVA